MADVTAVATVLPCDGDGLCMVCKTKPSAGEVLTCKTCATPWHVACLPVPPQTMVDALQWDCPDCTPTADQCPIAGKPIGAGSSGDLVAAIKAVEADGTLTEREKAKKRQELMSKGKLPSNGESSNPDKEKINGGNDLLGTLGDALNCSFCMQIPERPVTTPCGHNFCLKCFQKWVSQGKRTCAICRQPIPAKFASHPRINSALVSAIRMAKQPNPNPELEQRPRVYHHLRNENRPDTAFTTERAKKPGKANASSGRIFVTVAQDHFGPIPAENDPERNQGVLVGESWADRGTCRQWGVHFPMVPGIAGQAKYGAQSVVLSGGYEDDEDHGEWFLYTGSGGRDLKGNKRTNKTHSWDQKFEAVNEALRVSCLKGYPVRVVRSHKERRSSYAPEKGQGLRYDGVYRVEKCWRKLNKKQGFKVCRYLIVRCDNEPAPWTSDDHGDRPRPLPVINELKDATDLTERKESPSWDYDAERDCWMWKKPPPPSKCRVVTEYSEEGMQMRRGRQRKQNSVRERLLEEFKCHICRDVMTLPITTPCAHNFCKACIEGAFAGISLMRQRTCQGRRTLRAQKNIMKCPSCPTDIADFLQNLQVNRELMKLIETLKHQDEESKEKEEPSDDTDGSNEKLDLIDEEDEETEEEPSDGTDGSNEKLDLIDEEEDEETEEESSEDTNIDASHETHDLVAEETLEGAKDNILATQTEKANKQELQATAVERNTNQTCKRKKPTDGENVLDVEVRTRSKR